LARRLRRGFCGAGAVGGSIGLGGTSVAGPDAGADANDATVSSSLADCAAAWDESIADDSALPSSFSSTATGEGLSPSADLLSIAGGPESSMMGVTVPVGCVSGTVVGSSVCMIAPPAPNSTILMAHSLQATRWRHGRRMTSRGELRHTRHSDDGSSSVGAGAVGG
jgi:hypothetical protein